jgi:hypothetical protein
MHPRQLVSLLAFVASIAACSFGTTAVVPERSLPLAEKTSAATPSPVASSTRAPTPVPTASPTPTPSPTPPPPTMADAREAYAAAARTYAKAMKAADAGWPVVWCGTRIGRSPDPCDNSSVMTASVRAFKKSLTKEADAISTFIKTFEAIRFPTAALAPRNMCVIATQVDDPRALALAVDVCSLRAAVVEYRDQIAKAARGKTYSQIEPKGLMAGIRENSAQERADVLRKALRLPTLPKEDGFFYRSGRF